MGFATAFGEIQRHVYWTRVKGGPLLLVLYWMGSTLYTVASDGRLARSKKSFLSYSVAQQSTQVTCTLEFPFASGFKGRELKKVDCYHKSKKEMPLCGPSCLSQRMCYASYPPKNLRQRGSCRGGRHRYSALHKIRLAQTMFDLRTELICAAKPSRGGRGGENRVQDPELCCCVKYWACCIYCVDLNVSLPLCTCATSQGTALITYLSRLPDQNPIGINPWPTLAPTRYGFPGFNLEMTCLYAYDYKCVSSVLQVGWHHSSGHPEERRHAPYAQPSEQPRGRGSEEKHD
ncbi:hypothetical protein LZ31DRAFT_55650 [Colletotrichum somersetense]|nr:hypothetical protein LZ31DRAFT_55650 [Colletotrichum somersetense]